MRGALQGAARPSRRPFRRVPSTVVRAGASLAVLAVVAACAASPVPSDGPTTTASASPPTSPSPSAEPTPDPTPSPDPSATQSEDRSELLVQPADMERDDEVGAIAAAKYYMGLYEYVYLTGDLEMWESMAMPDCEFCNVVAESVREMHEAGRYRVSGPPEWLGEPTTERIATRVMWDVGLRAVVSAATEYDAAGSVLDEYEEVRNRVNLGMVHDGERWRTQGVVISDDH